VRCTASALGRPVWGLWQIVRDATWRVRCRGEGVVLWDHCRILQATGRASNRFKRCRVAASTMTWAFRDDRRLHVIRHDHPEVSTHGRPHQDLAAALCNSLRSAAHTCSAGDTHRCWHHPPVVGLSAPTRGSKMGHCRISKLSWDNLHGIIL
jgi:hypothetical protein